MRIRALALVVAVLAVAPAAAQAARCPSADRALPGAGAFRHLNAKEWSFGPRPTGSPAHAAMVDWLEGRLRAVPRLRVRTQTFHVTRWTPARTALTLRTGGRTLRLPVAAPVRLSRSTPARGTQARLAYVPDDEPITAGNAAGRIVVRDAPPGQVPLGAFAPGALGFALYDPGHTIDPGATFEGDFINYNARVHDLRDAGAAGAAGILFLKDLPRAQLRGHDEPYEGTRWKVPAVFLGADQSARVRAAATAGGASARLTLRARTRRVRTKTLLATLPGRRAQKLVVESHTDGTNAYEDNGPVAILAMARALAAQPRACRPRTIEFAFPTGHFYQHIVSPHRRHGGAGVLSRQLDRVYDKGRVTGVMVLEHLGTREYAARSRPGHPGRILRPTGRSELQQVAVTPSARLRAAVVRAIERNHVARTAMLVGADGADPARAPEHCSFGGEGTPYNERLLPTVAAISAPEGLYDPVFGLEAIDFHRMRRETVAFTDLLTHMGHMSRKAIAGDVLAERARRAAGAPGCPNDI